MFNQAKFIGRVFGAALWCIVPLAVLAQALPEGSDLEGAFETIAPSAPALAPESAPPGSQSPEARGQEIVPPEAVRADPDEGEPERSEGTLWHHNGSIVRLVLEGAKRAFFYVTPRPEMLQANWREGDLLFQGVAREDKYIGEAWLNSRRCGLISYRVAGSILDNGSRVVMTGKAPRRNFNSCRVTGYLNDRLEFTLVEPR